MTRLIVTADCLFYQRRISVFFKPYFLNSEGVTLVQNVVTRTIELNKAAQCHRHWAGRKVVNIKNPFKVTE